MEAPTSNPINSINMHKCKGCNFIGVHNHGFQEWNCEFCNNCKLKHVIQKAKCPYRKCIKCDALYSQFCFHPYEESCEDYYCECCAKCARQKFVADGI